MNDDGVAKLSRVSLRYVLRNGDLVHCTKVVDSARGGPSI